MYDRAMARSPPIEAARAAVSNPLVVSADLLPVQRALRARHVLQLTRGPRHPRHRHAIDLHAQLLFPYMPLAHLVFESRPLGPETAPLMVAASVLLLPWWRTRKPSSAGGLAHPHEPARLQCRNLQAEARRLRHGPRRQASLRGLVSAFRYRVHLSRPGRATTCAMPRSWRDADSGATASTAPHKNVAARRPRQPQPLRDLKVISCIRQRCLDPLVTGTRSNDVDPGAFGYLQLLDLQLDLDRNRWSSRPSICTCRAMRSRHCCDLAMR